MTSRCWMEKFSAVDYNAPIQIAGTVGEIMQTVNFNCSFCDKLMAVGLNLLGRNVRCPHCKKVVQAPATTTAPPSADRPRAEREAYSGAQPRSKQVVGDESIFGEAPNDDLFGRMQPEIGLPDDSRPPTFSELRAPIAAQPEYEPTANELSTNPFNEMKNAGSPDARSSEKPSRGKTGPETVSDPPAASRERAGGGALIWMLLAYSVIVTGIAAYLFYDRTVSK